MTENAVLIVDDEPDIRELLEITLGRMGLRTLAAANLAEARQALSEHKPQLCLTDMRLPDGNGIDLVREIQRDFPHLPVAMITAHGSVDTAIEALKAGAFDFISKPVDLEGLRSLVQSALQAGLPDAGSAGVNTGRLTGETPAIKDLRQQVEKVARSQAPVHIHGESGTGKEVVAKLIHRMSPRSQSPFVAVNCGAIPAELMESELFGHIKGSFTGANRDKPGLFDSARGGTLFLDEIADLPLSMQVKLLRAIQEKRIRPVGSSNEIATDVRLLSATHKHLATEVREGRFREDLYFRINVIDLRVPALRERLDDLPALADSLLTRIAANNGITAPALDEPAIVLLKQHSFPGNVRELENILERAVALADGDTIGTRDLRLGAAPLSLRATGPGSGQTADHQDLLAMINGDLIGYLDSIESKALLLGLEQCNGNRTDAARTLGLSFRSLRYRLKKLGLDV